EYDVCIVGSGAGGGMAAHELTKEGADVIMLEAGGWFDSEDFSMVTWPYESRRRGRGTQLQPLGEFDAAFGGWDVEGEPYGQVNDSEFKWFRSRMLGVRTNHCGGLSW